MIEIEILPNEEPKQDLELLRIAEEAKHLKLNLNLKAQVKEAMSSKLTAQDILESC